MKIKESSWHYWLNSKFNERMLWNAEKGRVTDCKYVWTTAGSVITALMFSMSITLVILALIVITTSIICPIIATIALLLGIEASWIPYGAYPLIWMWLAIATIVSLAGWTSNEIKTFPDYLKSNKVVDCVKESETTSLVLGYLKAKKAKFCTYVEIE